MGKVIDISQHLMDISEPEVVEIQIRADGKVVWVNVDSVCRFRACRVKKIEIKDERKG